jgi:hypothetical protein
MGIARWRNKRQPDLGNTDADDVLLLGAGMKRARLTGSNVMDMVVDWRRDVMNELASRPKIAR